MLNFQIKDYNMDCMSSKLLSLTGDNAGFAKNTCNACPDILRKDVIFWCLETKSTSSFDQATDLDIECSLRSILDFKAQVCYSSSSSFRIPISTISTMKMFSLRAQLTVLIS